MAAIDKLYVKSYWEFEEFRLWVIINKPSLLTNIYSPFETNYESWEKRKNKKFDDDNIIVMNFFSRYPTLEDYRKTHKEYISEDNIVDDYKSMVKLCLSLRDEWTYKNNISFSIANFDMNQDRWLFWHCPLDFVREYLKEQCGYKEKWYHKIIFKFTWKQNN